MRQNLRDRIAVIQLLLISGGLLVSVVLYVHSSFATNEKVQEVEKKVKATDVKIEVVQSVLCKMAIEQQLKGAVEICTRNKVRGDYTKPEATN